MKTTGRNKNDLPLLIVNFMGKNVAIITSQNSSSTIITDQGPIVETQPLIFEGILIDEDDNYYYLGKNISHISIRVKKSEEIAMEVVEEKDPVDEVFDNMPEPEGNEIN